MMQHIQ